MKRSLLVVLVLVAIAAVLLYRPSVSMEKLKKKYTDEHSSFVEINGMTVHYRKSGEGFPVLLVHGTSASLHTWTDWQDRMDEHFTVYSVDLPGCGLTGPHPDDDYSIAAYLEFLEAFTGAMQLDSFYIAGNSLGGHIAWEYAAISPKITKAVLVDPSGYYLQDRKTPLVFKLGRKKFFAAIVEGLNVRPLISKSLHDVYYDDEKVTADLVRRYSDLTRRKGNRKAFIKKAAIEELSDASELHGIDIPVFLQWGREDLWIPLELADVFTENIANSRLVIYENCGHVPQEEIPEISANDAITFLLDDLDDKRVKNETVQQ